jgi:hypothetical protein
MSDEIIRTLRATKERLAQDAGLDIKRLIESIQQGEKQSAAQGRVVLQPPSGNQSPSSFQKIRFAGH